MDLEETEATNSCAGKAQQQFNQLTKTPVSRQHL
jgi:hypothetical protein